MARAGSGDKLASGGIKANFQTTDGRVSEDKWAAAFDDFSPEEFAKTRLRSEPETEDETEEPITR